MADNPPKEKFKYKVKFVSDVNNYYVSEKMDFMWYDNTGSPVTIGKAIESSDDDEFEFYIRYRGIEYAVESTGRLILITKSGAWIESGTVTQLPEPKKSDDVQH